MNIYYQQSKNGSPQIHSSIQHSNFCTNFCKAYDTVDQREAVSHSAYIRRLKRQQFWAFQHKTDDRRTSILTWIVRISTRSQIYNKIVSNLKQDWSRFIRHIFQFVSIYSDVKKLATRSQPLGVPTAFKARFWTVCWFQEINGSKQKVKQNIQQLLPLP